MVKSTMGRIYQGTVFAGPLQGFHFGIRPTDICTAGLSDRGVKNPQTSLEDF
jgi:hypothetical protein